MSFDIHTIHHFTFTTVCVIFKFVTKAVVNALEWVLFNLLFFPGNK